MRSTSSVRTFVTPPLQADTTYYYNARAERILDGRTVSETKQVTVRGGGLTRVRFTFEESSIAQR
jgi:uncharacterized protein (TIGR03000 family)